MDCVNGLENSFVSKFSFSNKWRNEIRNYVYVGEIIINFSTQINRVIMTVTSVTVRKMVGDRIYIYSTERLDTI